MNPTDRRFRLLSLRLPPGRAALLAAGMLALAFGVGLWGQWTLDRRPASPWPWAPLLAGAVAFALLSRCDALERGGEEAAPALAPRLPYLALALALAALAFPGFAGNRFRLLPTTAWLASLVLLYQAFRAVEHAPRSATGPGDGNPPRCGAQGLHLQVTWHALALAGVLLVAAVLRLNQLDAIPREMGTDGPLIYENAREIMEGDLMIFCPRYPGRESLFFYILAAYGRLFGLSFFGIKLTSALVGVATVLALYGLARYLFDREVGLVAAALLAISKWHVILSRTGFRAILMPLAVVATIFFLARALRRGRAGDFVVAGLILGLGMYTYNAFLVVPAIVCVALAVEFGLRGRAALRRYGWGPVGFALGALLVYLPLARYALEEPHLYLFRVSTRLTSMEVPLPPHPLHVFAGNLGRAAAMFNLRGDVVPYSNVPLERQLGAVSGAFFVLGLAYALARWRRGHNAMLLIFLGGLILPTALSVAFPQEVPNAARASGALAPACLLAALPPVLLRRRLVGAKRGAAGRPALGAPAASRWRAQGRAALQAGALTAVALAALAALLGVELRETWQAYFQDYVRHLPGRNYALSLELARALDGFAGEGRAYVKAWPHWYDGNALRAQLKVVPKAGDWELTELDPARPPLSTAAGQVLFIVHPEDREALEMLRSAFPRGVAVRHRDYGGQVAYISFYGER